MTDVQAIQGFLAEYNGSNISANALRNIVAFDPKKVKKARAQRKNYSIDRVAAWCVYKGLEGYNIYFHAGETPRSYNANRKPNYNEVTGVKYLWADADPDTPADGWDDWRRTFDLETVKIPPTLLVDSGRGFQFYWRLKEECTDIDRAKKAMRAIATEHDFDRSVAEPTRVMRLVGTENQKTGNTARLLRSNDLSYDIAELEEMYPYTEPQPAAPPPSAPSAPSAPSLKDAPTDLGADSFIEKVLQDAEAACSEGNRDNALSDALGSLYKVEHRTSRVVLNDAEKFLWQLGKTQGLTDAELTNIFRTGPSDRRETGRKKPLVRDYYYNGRKLQQTQATLIELEPDPTPEENYHKMLDDLGIKLK